MKMEVLAVQSNYGGVLGSNKVRDWTSTLTPPTSAVAAKKVAPVANSASSAASSSSIIGRSQNTHSIKHKQQASSSSSSGIGSKKTKSSSHPINSSSPYSSSSNSSSSSSNSSYSCDEDELAACSDVDVAAVSELSNRLLDKLREAKARHLACTEVSLPCDLTPNIAADIIRVSEKEPCGTRGCTIYVEFEDEPQNSRRIASLKVDPETVSTFEVYLTLRQDHRGWTALLPQFMKSLARTITISPEYTITKHKLYSADGLGARRSYSFGSSSSSSSSHSQAIATPTI
ncbi:protein scylla [Drosophila montana]|uniref:protein scylla n=1 Tax=Drosophila montana TaxID=40370 RepID=UPI00313DD66C